MLRCQAPAYRNKFPLYMFTMNKRPVTYTISSRINNASFFFIVFCLKRNGGKPFSNNLPRSLVAK